MATIYVSNSTANGYGMGDDSRSRATAASKATPVLTLTRAYAVCLAGDAIVLNDGVYNEVGYVWPSRANLTITGETVLGATIRSANGADTRVLRIASGGTGIVIGPVIIDAEGKSSCVTFDATVGITATLHGTRLIGFTGSSGVFSSTCPASLTMDQSWSIVLASQATVSGVLQLTPTAAASCDLRDGSITAAGSNASLYGIKIDPSTGGSFLSCVIDNVTVTLTHTGASTVACIYSEPRNSATITTFRARNCTLRATSSGSSAAIYGVWGRGAVDSEATDNDVVLTAQNDLQGTIVCEIFRTIAAYSPTRVYVARNSNSIVQVDPANQRGTGVQVGDDADTAANANSITGVLVEHNVTTHTNHGVILAWITGAAAQGNLTDDHVIGVIGKYSTNCLFSGNIMTRPNTSLGTGSLRSKGASGDIYTNNLIIQLAGYKGMAMQADTGSVAPIFQNNIVYAEDGTQLTKLTVVSTTGGASTAVFRNNNYYSAGGIGTTAFVYLGSTYATLAAWIAAQEASAFGVDPGFVNVVGGDYRLSVISPLRTAGFSVPNTFDFLGKSFEVPSPIGPYALRLITPRGSRKISTARRVNRSRIVHTTRVRR